MPQDTDWEAWTDAGVISGRVASGAWVIRHCGNLVEEHSIDLFHCGNRLCIKSSFAAELFTFKACSYRILKLCRGNPVMFYTDSQSIVQSFKKGYTAEQECTEWIIAIKDRLARELPGSRIIWVPREENTAANLLASRQKRRLLAKDTRLTVYRDGVVSDTSMAPFHSRVSGETNTSGDVVIRRRDAKV